MERRITQFADHKFIGVLERHGVRISMDGKGRCMDNIFIERLWRSVKYEEMYCGAESRGLRAS
jgi:putative transposase